MRKACLRALAPSFLADLAECFRAVRTLLLLSVPYTSSRRIRGRKE